MKVVYKYEAELADVIPWDLPIGAKILRVDSQNHGNIIALWALVDPDVKVMKTRNIRIAGTGHHIYDSHIEYINTFTMLAQALWFHVFEIL